MGDLHYFWLVVEEERLMVLCYLQRVVGRRIWMLSVTAEMSRRLMVSSVVLEEVVGQAYFDSQLGLEQQLQVVGRWRIYRHLQVEVEL